MKQLGAFIFGVVFALGLGLGGMTQPTKVIGFLDFTGDWDPTLGFVMGGAVAVTFVLFPRILRRQTSWLGDAFALPQKKAIDVPLLLGAALFGAGWGLSGYCPGPAVVSLVTGALPVMVFASFMAVGFRLAGFISSRSRPAAKVSDG